MARIATDLREKFSAMLRARCLCLRHIARRSLRRAQKSRDEIEILQTIRARMLVRFDNRIAEISDLFREEPVRDAHFVDVGVPGKRKQARLLILPAEPPDPGLSWRLDDRHTQRLPA